LSAWKSLPTTNYENDFSLDDCVRGVPGERGACAERFAQSVAGTWQGTLQAANKDLRTVIKISGTPGDRLQAVFYSIDQNSPGIPGTVSLQGTVVKITIPGIGGSYDGKLSPDRNSMTGTFLQGPGPLPLDPDARSATDGVGDSGACAPEADGAPCESCLK